MLYFFGGLSMPAVPIWQLLLREKRAAGLPEEYAHRHVSVFSSVALINLAAA